MRHVSNAAIVMALTAVALTGLVWTTIEALEVDMVERAKDRELTVESEQEVLALAEALRASA